MAMDFVKLHGTGNDFVVVDARAAIDARAVDRDWSALALAVCDRHFGVGADGLILATESDRADTRMRIFNADGSEAEMSGNGMRCLVKFVADAAIVSPRDDAFKVETGAGVLSVRITSENGRVTSVRQSMGPPRLDPREIPVAIDAPPPIMEFEIDVGGQSMRVTPVSMGNPHAVLFQRGPVAQYPLREIGPLVEHHRLFPKRTNFEVVRMVDRSHAEMRVWERGVGETLSCGSGASATMVAARLLDRADGTLALTVPGGVLDLEWDGEGDVILTGPVVESFRGTWPD